MKRYGAVILAAVLLAACTSKPEPGGWASPEPEASAEVRSVGTGIGTDPLKFVGEFEVIAKDKRGKVKDRRHVKNLIVDAGKAGVAGLIIATGHTNAFDHIAIGTGTTAAAAGNTACETEITTNGGQRALATLSRVTTDVTNDTAQAEVTYAFTGSFAVTEACLLDSLTTGVMLARQVFSAVNVISGDSLLVRYKVDVD